MNTRKHPAQSTGEPPINWPNGVLPISQDGLGHLGVGNDGKLYWDGFPVEVDRRVTFSTWQIVFGVASLFVASVAASSAAISAYVDIQACAPYNG